MSEPKPQSNHHQSPPRAADKVTNSELKSVLHPFIKPIKTICNPAIPIPTSEVKKLTKIARPEVMEDRWIIIPDGPNEKGELFIRFYRSWSQFKIWTVKVVGVKIAEEEKKGLVGKIFGRGKWNSGEEEGRTRIVEVVWEGDKEIYNVSGEDIVRDVLGIMKSTLGVNLESGKA